MNLEAAYTLGVGVQLSWDAVPGSQAAQLKLVSPTGATIKKNLVGFEPDAFFIPDAVLTTGLYSWRVQASCNTTLPLLLTPVSAADLFTVGTGTGLCPTNISDIDGNSYDVAEIDGKCWMRENLQTLSYRNGDPIPAIASAAAWAGLSSGAASAYDNEVSNINTYGVLYNGYAVTDPRGLCPAGWSVPTSPEWLALIDFAGGVDIAGGPLKAVGLLGSGTGLWKAPNSGATNATNFSALPGGYRRPDGSYIGKSEMAIWWTRNTAALGELWGGRVYNNDINVNIDGFSVQNGFSVRCLMD
jgi:uncharacterized protein (TIGR02145 family)